MRAFSVPGAKEQTKALPVLSSAPSAPPPRPSWRRRMFHNKFVVLPCLNCLSQTGNFRRTGHDNATRTLSKGGGQDTVTHKTISRVKMRSGAWGRRGAGRVGQCVRGHWSGSATTSGTEVPARMGSDSSPLQRKGRFHFRGEGGRAGWPCTEPQPAQPRAQPTGLVCPEQIRILLKSCTHQVPHPARSPPPSTGQCTRPLFHHETRDRGQGR